MSDNYEVNKVWIEEAEFEILILKIPGNEINDKLAYFARDKGKISKSFYEDFIITSCVANINQLLYRIKSQPNGGSNLLKIREEIMDAVLKDNPLLIPDNLVINRNSVIKLKDPVNDGDDERSLTDNKSWNLNIYEEMEYTEPDEDSKDKDFIKTKNIEDESKNVSGSKIDSLDRVVTRKWWKRINKYINVNKYRHDDIQVILGSKYFHNKDSFKTFVVTICVDDFESLMHLLDEMGITNRVSGLNLVSELYDLCKETNSFLTYSNALEYSDEDGEEQPNVPSRGNKMSSHVRQDSKKKKKKQKTFKDVSKEELLSLADIMKMFVIGQDEAVDAVVESIQRASVGLKDPVKPIGSFLFAGRTGIGKTLTSTILADELIKGRGNLVTIDCSEYSSDHEYAKLIGAPSGYVGHEQGGILTNSIIEKPFSVVVFDEVEKASNKVHELMLQILEEGRLTDGRGQKASFKDAVIIMTSNIGVTEVNEVKKTIGFGDVAELTETKKTKAIDGAIKDKFKPEFINRIDSIVHFKTLEKEDYFKIIELELFKLNDNLRSNDTEFKDITLEFDKKIKDFIFKHGVDTDFGARPLKRCIEKEISTSLAARLLRGDIALDSTIKVSVKRGDINFVVKKVKKKKSKPQVLVETDACEN